MSELKSCPFCGGRFEIDIDEEGGGIAVYHFPIGKCIVPTFLEDVGDLLEVGNSIADLENIINVRPTEYILQSRIKELEARLNMPAASLYGQYNKAQARIAELEAQLLGKAEQEESLREIIQDYREDTSRVLNEQCPTDEKHCGCVPILRKSNRCYRNALVLITTLNELPEIITVANRALNENFTDYSMAKACGEYWADKYDILQNDYADVCQKRLEAAESFSKKIIELEAENAALKEAQRWIPVGERLPKVDNYVSDRVEVCYIGYKGKIFVSEICCGYLPKDWTVDGWTYIAGWYPPNSGVPIDENVTHWRPLPQPPESE